MIRAFPAFSLPVASSLAHGAAAGASLPGTGGTLISLPRDAARSRGDAPGAAAGQRCPGVDTHQLSYRDEEIVLRSRAGELPHDIATALDHDLLVVMRALNRAIALGLPIRP